MFASVVKVTRIGTREFLQVGCYVIPIDRIREIDFAPDKGSGCDVIILAENKSNTRRSYGFNGEFARLIGEFFNQSAPSEEAKPGPAVLVEQVERIIDILADSRSRGHGARIEDASEALQELRRQLMAEGNP
jgi:hypothetical protein